MRDPVTVKSLLIEDEAVETKPPYKVERPETARVEDAPIEEVMRPAHHSAEVVEKNETPALRAKN
jgi:hypothetical protein